MIVFECVCVCYCIIVWVCMFGVASLKDCVFVDVNVLMCQFEICCVCVSVSLCQYVSLSVWYDL